MNLPFSAPTPLDYFTSLVQSDVDFPLLEAAISVAQDEYPDMDVQTVLNVVDQLLERLRRRIPADAAALQRLRVLNQFLFLDLGFGGNANDYYDPDNSFVHESILGERCYARLEDIPEPVDMVDVFRRPEDVPPIAASAVAIGAKCLWQQLGVASQEADTVARAAGLDSVMDRCVKVEHARLLST